MKKLLLAAALFLTPLVALAQGPGPGPGPGPVPDPWVVNGSQLSYGGCLTIPAGVSGGCKGNGTVNAATLYQNGFAVLSTDLANGRILVGNGSGVATPVTPSGDLTMTNAGVFTVSANVITNAKLAQAAAVTLKGNPTNATANVQDFTLAGLTALGSPNTTLDLLLIWDHTAGTFKSVTPSAISTAVGGITALTGDVTATGPGSVAATLATVNANVGSFGSSTAIPVFTVNGKGLITAASTAAVIAPAGTLTGTTLASNVVSSSLTSVGTLTGGATGAGFTVALTTSTVTGNLPIANAPSIAANTALGSIAGGTAAALSKTQLTTLVNTFTTTLSGAVPAPGSVTGAVLSDNGTWISVGGTGTVTSITCAATLTCTASNPITGSGTIALNLSNANTWAAAQTFSNSTIKLLGSSTGATTFTSANAGASNFTLTVPAITATLATTIASGAKTLATGAISSGACTAAQTDTATGTLTTDAIMASFNGDPTAVTGYVPLVTGMLTIIAYPTADTVNFKVCNNTASSITPGAVTINWRVAR